MNDVAFVSRFEGCGHLPEYFIRAREAELPLLVQLFLNRSSLKPFHYDESDPFARAARVYHKGNVSMIDASGDPGLVFEELEHPLIAERQVGK
jgi:hypothetical protein